MVAWSKDMLDMTGKNNALVADTSKIKVVAMIAVFSRTQGDFVICVAVFSSLYKHFIGLYYFLSFFASDAESA